MIKCDLREINEHLGMVSSKKRYGKYHGSRFWNVPGFGVSAWVVGVYIDLDFDNVDPSMSEVDILESCVEFLNEPPPRRKYQKKKPEPRYGTLSPLSCKVIQKNGQKLLSALLITNKRKNKMFWSEGENVPVRKRG